MILRRLDDCSPRPHKHLRKSWLPLRQCKRRPWKSREQSPFSLKVLQKVNNREPRMGVIQEKPDLPAAHANPHRMFMMTKSYRDLHQSRTRVNFLLIIAAVVGITWALIFALRTSLVLTCGVYLVVASTIGIRVPEL